MLAWLNWMLDWLDWLLFQAGDTTVSVAQRYWIGLIATLACVAVASYFASEVKSNQRLFTVLALYAGAMAALASVYDAAEGSYTPGQVAPFKLPDRASDLASFIMVFAGTILAREGGAEHWPERWVFNLLQSLAVALLVALVIPRQLSSMVLSQERWELILGGALALVGFLALGLGAYPVSHGRLFGILVIILAVYAGFDTGRTLEVLLAASRRPMSVFFIFALAVAKLFLTFTFGCIVYRHHLSHPRGAQVPGPAPPSDRVEVPASVSS